MEPCEYAVQADHLGQGAAAIRCCLPPSLQEAAARFLKGLKTLFDPLSQLSINTARPVSFRTPATHHCHPRPPHQPIFPPSQWRLRYVPLYLPSSPPLRPADAPRLLCDRHANMATAREVRRTARMHSNAQHIDTPAARLSSPGFASRLSATMVSPRPPPAVAAQANSVLAEMVTYMKVCLCHCSCTLRSHADLFCRKWPRYADLICPPCGGRLQRSAGPGDMS
jgi:hypothetical protein